MTLALHSKNGVSFKVTVSQFFGAATRGAGMVRAVRALNGTEYIRNLKKGTNVSPFYKIHVNDKGRKVTDQTEEFALVDEGGSGSPPAKRQRQLTPVGRKPSRKVDDGDDDGDDGDDAGHDDDDDNDDDGDDDDDDDDDDIGKPSVRARILRDIRARAKVYNELYREKIASGEWKTVEQMREESARENSQQRPRSRSPAARRATTPTRRPRSRSPAARRATAAYQFQAPTARPVLSDYDPDNPGRVMVDTVVEVFINTYNDMPRGVIRAHEQAEYEMWVAGRSTNRGPSISHTVPSPVIDVCAWPHCKKDEPGCEPKMVQLKGQDLMRPALRDLMRTLTRKIPRVMGGAFFYGFRDHANQLFRLNLASRKALETFRKWEIDRSTAPMNKKDFGVINWDLPYTPAAWALELHPTLGTPDPMNPRVNPDRTIHFHRSNCAVAWFDFDSFVPWLRKRQPGRWDNICPDPVMYHAKATAEHAAYHRRSDAALQAFLRNPKQTVVFLAWGMTSGTRTHARVGYKCESTRGDGEKSLCVIDPWQQHGEGFPGSHLVREEGFSMRFVARDVEQGMAEGSCGLMSLVRVLAISQLGDRGATDRIDSNMFDYIMVVSRIKRKTR